MKTSALHRIWESPLRLFLVFAAGIIIPAMLLAYLGYRSFHYEAELRTKLAEERFRSVVQGLEQRSAEWVGQFLQPFETAASQASAQRGTEALNRYGLLLQTISGVPCRRVFIFDSRKTLLFPSVVGGNLNPPIEATLNWGEMASALRRYEKLEFAEKDLVGAVRGYESLLMKANEPDLQVVLIKNIAGAHRKLKDYKKAEQGYRRLIVSYSTAAVNISNLPIGVAARQILISLYDEMGQPESALRTELDLLEGLALGRWPLPEAQSEALWTSRKKNVALRLNKPDDLLAEFRLRFNALDQLHSQLSARRADANRFVSQEAPIVFKELKQAGLLDVTACVFLGGDRLFVSAPMVDSVGERSGSLVLEVDAEALLGPLKKLLEQQAITSGVGLSLEKPRSAAGDSMNLTLSGVVDRIAPQMEFWVQRSGGQADVDQFLRRRLKIYTGIIALSILVIGAGLVVMFQAVRRERENAQLKTDFVANVSHELRTPLAAISYIGELLDRGRYRSAEEAKEFYGLLRDETKRLRGMVEDILDFSKMMAGKKVYDREVFDLKHAVHEAESRFRSRATAAGFELVLSMSDEELFVEADFKAVVRALLNILENALKYSGASRRIEISSVLKGTEACVAVRDFGVGIAAAEQTKIFEKFYRVEGTMARESEGGVGLGLAMVKHIVEGQSARITLTSTVGEGSTFVFHFPLVQSMEHVSPKGGKL